MTIVPAAGLLPTETGRRHFSYPIPYYIYTDKKKELHNHESFALT